MTEIAEITRVWNINDEIASEGFVEYNVGQWPGYWVKHLAPPRDIFRHMINVVKLAPGARKVHAHEAENVMLVLEGEGEYYNDFDKTQPVKAGDVCVAMRQQPHGMINTSDKLLVYFVVEGPLDARESS